LYTRKDIPRKNDGSLDWENEKYYTTNQLQYVGRFLFSERWSEGNETAGAENFENARIVLDHEGRTSFRPVPCKSTGGKRNRRNKRSKKNKKKVRRSRKN